MFLKIFTLFVLFTGIKGSDDYIFDDKAEGWLKLYKIPSGWNDANIRCEIEGAVLASPVVVKLRDAIYSFVNRQGGVTAIYTGIRSDFERADFFSLEGVSLLQVPVKEFARSSIDYGNSDSCIVWDMVGLAYLRRTKCEAKFPYVCYKKRTQSDLLAQLEPITESGFGARDPETNPDTLPHNRPSTGQFTPDQHLPPQDRQPSSNPNIQDTRANTHLQHYPAQYPKTSHLTTSISGLKPSLTSVSGTNQQIYPTRDSQTQTYSGQQGHQQNGPGQSTKCSFDRVENLIVVNNKDISTIMNYLADKHSVTVLFADSVYMAQNGSMWQVDVQNIGSSQPTNRQPPPVVHITPDIVEPQQNQGNQQSGSQGPHHVDPSASQPTVPQGSQTYQESFSQTPNQSYNGQGSEKNYNTGAYGNQTNGTDYQHNNNNGGYYSGSQGSPQDVTSQRPTSPYDHQPDIITPRVSDQPNQSQNPTQTGYSKLLKKAGGRFKLHQQPETFTAAATRCASEGAVLASPLTTDLKDALTNYVWRKTVERTVEISSFYIGVRANFSNGDYYSTEGVPLTKMPVSLNPGSPSSFQGSDSCITMSTNDNIVTSVKCTDRYPYVCFKQSKLVRSCGTQDLAYKYEQSTQSCYKFQNIGKTWSEAYQICGSEGGYLAILNSREESDALKKIFSKYPTNKIRGQYKYAVYVGVRDWHDGNSWMSVKSESLQSVGYTGWAPNSPSNVSGHDCGTLARNGLLFNDPCTLKLAFICEKDPELLYDDQDKS